MSAHDVLLNSNATHEGNASRTTRPLDGDSILQMARRLVVFNTNGQQIASLMDKARQAIPMLTSAEVVQKIATHNPDCFWGIARRDNFDINNPVAEGYYSFLPLNKEGLQGLLLGTFDRRNPPIEYVTAQNEKPAGVYIWHVYAPGQLAVAVTLACRKIWSLHNQDISFYSWSINEAAEKFVEGMGFKKMPKVEGGKAPQFHVFRRKPPQASSVSTLCNEVQAVKPSNLSVRVARSFDDLMRAVALRGAVYIGEQQCPYDEEFDGNDFSGSHLIGYVNDEPAGCVRIRYFADFAKIERLVVAKKFRSLGLGRELINASVDLCKAKGYQCICAHAQERYVSFWKYRGFVVPSQPRYFSFSDFNYVEMIHQCDRLQDSITSTADPFVMIRPEGDWTRPGILEKSALRNTPTRQASVGIA